MISKAIRAGAVAAALLGSTLMLAPAPAQAAGKCTAKLSNSNHTATGTCTGYMTTGTFRVLASYCVSSCYTIAGNWAALQGGKSTTSSQYTLFNARIEYGPM